MIDSQAPGQDSDESVRPSSAADTPQSSNLEDQAGGFVGELARRRVFRMAGWYAGSAFLIIQASQVLIEALYLSPWILTGTVILAAIGFPIALLLSWIFDITPQGIQRSARGIASPGWYPKWRLVGAAILMILVSGAAALSTTSAGEVLKGVPLPRVECSGAGCEPSVLIEPNRFAVLPLSHEAGAALNSLDGEVCARLIADGISHWKDINLADPLRVNDELRKLTPALRTQIPVDSGLAIARRVGAGRLIMGELWQHGDTTRIEAVLYDAVHGQMLKQRGARFPAGSGPADHVFKELAQQLLLDDSKLEIDLADATASRSHAAIVAFDSAFKAIREWQLDRAEIHFNKALQRDPDYVSANLWLAHVLLWRGDTAEIFKHHAARARSSRERLGPNDRLLADGVGLLATKRYAEACEKYRELLERDSASFHAWFGLSECLANDRRVVRDESSSSGWSFASSHGAAVRAHQRALALVPSFNEAFVNIGSTRFASLLFLNSNQMVSGTASDGSGARFAARPEIISDTLALIPYPHAAWRDRPVPQTNEAAVTRHREMLRQAAQSWAVKFPKNTKALEALAITLELVGTINTRGDGNDALGMIRRARKFETNRARQLHLQMIHVRLLVKSGQFKDARKLATRTLKEHPHPSAQDAQRLAGMAGLVGRPHTMARLLSGETEALDYDVPSSGAEIRLPVDFARDIGRLMAYAYVGEPRDSLRIVSHRAHAYLANRVSAENRQAMHEAVLDRAARVLFPLIGPEEAHYASHPSHPIVRMQGMLVRGDTTALRTELNKRIAERNAKRPAEASSDGALLLAQLQLALGDTAEAVLAVDAYLSDLGNLTASHFRQAYQPPTIVRMMILRAELAAKSNDRKAARKWSRAVVDLWSEGDEELKSTLAAMRKLARF